MLNKPHGVLNLWEKFKTHMSEDYTNKYNDELLGINHTLYDLNQLFIQHRLTLSDFKLPQPDPNLLNLHHNEANLIKSRYTVAIVWYRKYYQS